MWLTKSNNVHFFDIAEDVRIFTRLTDHRVREHAPFGVFGVYTSTI
jgi:hypothetical protein